jgi:hypothetical protein
VIARLAALIANIAGKPDPAVIARELVALAVETGIPANVLASYLTQASVERASRVANAAEAAKFG